MMPRTLDDFEYEEQLEELGNLIEAALDDGVLTDKERAILLRRAKSLGLDEDEFEMKLEYCLRQRKKQLNSNKDVDKTTEQSVEAPPASKATRPAEPPVSSSSMFSKELESLIQAALEDGILEDYEKAAIVKRAKAEGVDLAELEIYIKSILQKRKKEQVQAEESNQISSTQILADKIAQIKSEYYERDKDENEDEDDVAKAKTDSIIDAITMFAVPNNKEDIIEFLSLAAVNSKIKGGLWGTLSGRFKIFGILVLVILIVGIIFLCNCGRRVSDDEATTLILITALPLMLGCIILFGCGLDIIRTNKVAKAWRDKFKQVLMKARCLREDPDFSQRLDYFENQVK